MNTNHYSGGLTREQFLFFEIRIVAGLLCEGLSREEILEKVAYENLFQFPTERMIKTIARACFRRIDALDSQELTRLLVDSSPEVAKQINLYAIMCENSIVYDFFTEVIGEKYKTQQFDFSGKDINLFFIRLSEKIPAVSEWSEATIKKLKQVLVRFMIECEYLESPKSQTLLPVYLFEELENTIRCKGDNDALAAFNCLI